MKVTVETKDTMDKPCDEMQVCSVGILTQGATGDAQTGDVVIRVLGELYFPEHGTYSQSLSRYRFRSLQPGEKIIIEG